MAFKIKLFSPFTLIITIFLVMYVSAIGIKSFFSYNVFKKDYQVALSSVNEEKKRNKQLNKEYDALHKARYLDLMIRKSLFYTLPGEVTYKFNKL